MNPLNPIEMLIRLYGRGLKDVVVFMLAIAVPGLGTQAIVPHIVSLLDLSDAGEMLAMAGCFFGLLAVEIWIYGRFERWRLIRRLTK
jgi:hypothetical protein